MKYTVIQTPRGAKDILPPEAYKKNRLEQRVAEYVERWGYDRITTPTFEFYDAVAQGDGPEMASKLYRFVDRDGTMLALRPEMTIPIARVAATRFQPGDMPLRLYYIGSAFRYDEPQAGRYREFTQAGVELLGPARPEADAEVVALALGVIEHMGLSSFRVDLGHSRYINGLLEGAGEERLVSSLRQAMLDQDYVRYEDLIKESGLDKPRQAALLALPTLRGDASVLDEALGYAKGIEGAAKAVENVREVLSLVRAYGFEDRVSVDFGMIKDLDYYSGLLIEGYTPELGFSLCTGGRYDRLVGRFGRHVPATGFAFGIERAMLALDKQGWDEKPPTADVFLTGATVNSVGAIALFDVAAKLRQQGVRVELDVDGLSEKQSIERAAQRGIPQVLRLLETEKDDPTVELVDGGEKTFQGSLSQGLEHVRGVRQKTSTA